MTDILIPHHAPISYPDWFGLELILPQGYRMVACVERPDGTAYDLGRNSAGEHRLFRRLTGTEFENSHCQKGEPLSETDLQGFGLTRDQCPVLPGDLENEGDYAPVADHLKAILKGV